jgi:hypothetical protein
MKISAAVNHGPPHMKLLQPGPNPRRLAIAISRLIVLALVWAGQDKRQSAAAILRACETSLATHWRWRQKFYQRGFSGLFPETAHNGRKPKSQKF